MKNNLMKSTLILIIGGIITKILSMVIRVSISRTLGLEGISIYMMILPTFSLLISVANLGLPNALATLISSGRKSKRLIFSIMPITLTFDILIIILITCFSNTLSIKLLNNSSYKDIIISIGLVLPFIDISAILRGYFFGKQRMIPHVLSNIVEDLVRLILIIIGTPFFLKTGLLNGVRYVILVNIASELSSILILLFFLPKNFKISLKDLKTNIDDIKDTFKIGIPSTISRLIGNIGYFLEPIIISHYILDSTLEYGIINGYVMPILLLPSFFTYAISSALLPIIGKNKNNKKFVKRKINQAIIYSLSIGLPFTIFIMLFPKVPLNFLYHTNEGVNYIRLLAPIFLLHYIQAPLTSSMQALDMSFKAMKGTIYATIVRCLSLLILSKYIGINSILVATSLNIIIVTSNHIIKLKKSI